MQRAGKVYALIGCFIICFGAAGIGAMATRRAPEFYAMLAQPSWAPPSSVFGPVWTFLYALMAISLWLVWQQRGPDAAPAVANHRGAYVLFFTQLALNALWSWLFFAWRRGTMAEVEILILLVFIVMTIVAFWRVRRLAGALLLPYLAWVSYATALTFALVQRNPGVL